MNMRQVWGVAGGFFLVYILITLTHRPSVPERREQGGEPAPAATSAPEEVAATTLVAPSAVTDDGRYRGFTLLPPDGKVFGDKAAAALREVAAAGGGAVALQPAIHQPSATTGEVPNDPTASLLIDDTRSAIQAAKAAGFKVMLRPVVVTDDGLRAELAPPDPGVWLKSWQRALAPYLVMAEAEKVDVFCLGTKLGAIQGEAGWPALIAEARKAYSGKLTYAASHVAADGYAQVGFWNELDFVGIEAWFPLSQASGPRPEDLETGWAKVAEELEAWRAKAGTEKPVLFTSSGMPELAGAAADPASPAPTASEDPQLQAGAYAAFFKAVWPKPWLAGVFWHTLSAGGDGRNPYALAGRPALDVVRTNFLGVAASPSGGPN